MTGCTRRTAIQAGAAMLAALTMKDARGDFLTQSSAPKNMGNDAFQRLRLGEVLPEGWLKQQLRIQADGMGGHLDEFWPDVGRNSGWEGGTGESWERGPYFVDGLFPLAVALQDEALRAKAMRFITWTLQSQRADGMFGPAGNNDWWPRMVMLKVIDQYGDATGDPRADTFLTKYFQYQLATLPARPLTSWGKYRWQDEAMVAIGLYRRTGDPALLAVFRLLQRQGFDWVALFRNYPYTGPQTRAAIYLDQGIDAVPDGMPTHGVNNGQGLKMAAVCFQASGNPEERTNFRRQLDQLNRYHGMPTGMFSCDEHLAGLDPSQGTELCTVVETLFSLETALAAFGDPRDADQLEKIAFNALPGTFTDDMWAHQYDQQVNQVRVSRNSKPWTTNGPESNLYGLEPNFGCCTANFHQGWPKLSSSLWMRSADGGLAAMVWAPCAVRTKVHRGEAIALSVETQYPFRNTARIRIEEAPASAMPLHLRIPGWSRQTEVRVNGRSIDNAIVPATFLKLERTWHAGDSIEVTFDMQPAIRRGFRESISVERGPLVFSYSPGGRWVKLRDHGPTADWQVFAERPWNYALALDETTLSRAIVSERPLGTSPFHSGEAAIALQVPARRLPAWEDTDGVAQPVPQSPVKTDAALEQIELVPYASAKLRITSFPQCEPAA